MCRGVAVATVSIEMRKCSTPTLSESLAVVFISGWPSGLLSVANSILQQVSRTMPPAGELRGSSILSGK